MKARRALCYLVGEGISLARIAGIGQCPVSMVRLFLQGAAIPDGAGLRLAIAARALNVLRMPDLPPEPPPLAAQADLAEFARRWLDTHRGKGCRRTR